MLSQLGWLYLGGQFKGGGGGGGHFFDNCSPRVIVEMDRDRGKGEM